MSVHYYRLTTPLEELTGTEGAVRAYTEAYKAGGGTIFYISGPFDSPPPYRPPGERRRPHYQAQICALCFCPQSEHIGDLRCPEEQS